jgi:hypothetical protein
MCVYTCVIGGIEPKNLFLSSPDQHITQPGTVKFVFIFICWLSLIQISSGLRFLDSPASFSVPSSQPRQNLERIEEEGTVTRNGEGAVTAEGGGRGGHKNLQKSRKRRKGDLHKAHEPSLSGKDGSCWAPYMNKESEILWRQRVFFPEETEWEAEVRISTQASADKWVHRLHVHNMFTPSPAGRKIRRPINKGLIVIQDNCDGFKETIAPRDLGEIDHNMMVGLATVIPLSLPRLHDEVHVQKTQDLDEYGSPAVRVITREISDSNQGMRYNIHRQIINGDSFAHDSTIARKSRNQTDTIQVMLSEGDIITQVTHHSKFTWGEDSNPDRNSKYLVSLV